MVSSVVWRLSRAADLKHCQAYKIELFTKIIYDRVLCAEGVPQSDYLRMFAKNRKRQMESSFLVKLLSVNLQLYLKGVLMTIFFCKLLEVFGNTFS